MIWFFSYCQFRVVIHRTLIPEAVAQRCSVKKVFLKISQNSKENTKAFNVINETLAQVFSCEFCELFKNTFLTEHLWMTASAPSGDHFSCLNLVVTSDIFLPVFQLQVKGMLVNYFDGQLFETIIRQWTK